MKNPQGFGKVHLFWAKVSEIPRRSTPRNDMRVGSYEKGKTPLYTSTAGGQIGWIRYRGPFISLRIYDEFIVIGYAKTIVLRFEEIDRVEIKKWMGVVSDRIQIIHHKLDAPSNIIVGTTNPAQAKEIIDSKLQKQM